MPEKIDVKLINTSSLLTISYQSDLIMLHSDFISAQWHPDTVGIEIQSYNDTVELAFHPNSKTSPYNYQSWYFDIEHKEAILKFFMLLGFPCPQTPHFDMKE